MKEVEVEAEAGKRIGIKIIIIIRMIIIIIGSLSTIKNTTIIIWKVEKIEEEIKEDIIIIIENGIEIKKEKEKFIRYKYKIQNNLQ